MKKTCGTCKHFDPSDCAPRMGWCRAVPVYARPMWMPIVGIFRHITCELVPSGECAAYVSKRAVDKA